MFVLRDLGVFPILWLLLPSPSVAQQEDEAKRLAVLKRQAGERRIERRVAAYEDLLDLGPEGEAILVEAAERHLERELETFRKALKRSGTIGKKEKLLRAALDERRAEALRVIYDRSIYPDENHGRVGQPKVDEMVGLVREIWEDPTQYLLVHDEDVAAIIDPIDDTLQWIEIAGGELPEDLHYQALLDESDAIFDVEAWLPKSTLEWNRTIREYNRDGLFTMTEQERIVIDKTNEYRWMLGRRCLEADERLIRASRGHSEEMIELGYFAHRSPTPENSSPSRRAQNHGYPGGVAENIARTRGGAGAFNGWYNSSGHHRNMLGAGHVQIGVGGAGPDLGSHFTQCFGSRSSMRGRKVTDPELIYLGKLRELDREDAKALYSLAAWCQSQEMSERAREHAEAVIALEPNHSKARGLLGYRRSAVHGWVLEDESDG